MGKGKIKKSAPTAVSEGVSAPSDIPHCTCGHEHPRATDGHNVDGWTDEDIRIYNELLTERAKLEKEKNELEQKSARHQAERALLNEDAAAYDKLFKAELGGDYKFLGKTACCLDFEQNKSTAGKLVPSNSICHHEVCERAKSRGLSWMEMDTVKYYHSRISNEKSPRMKNALRKQRDVELARVKKEDEEEMALRNRRSALMEKALPLDASHPLADSHDTNDFSLLDALASKDSLLSPKDNVILDAAKENELVVKRIRSRLDKIRYDVHAGRVTAYDARMKLDQANKEMAEAERKNNTFKEMIFTAGGLSQGDVLAASSSASTTLSRALTKSLADSSTDAFSQALSVMKGFFSASDPRDVQAAIADLRSVLEINGPMSPVLQKSFQALEDMLAKPNAQGFTIDVPTHDGKKRTARNVVEVLLMLRDPKDRATLTSTAKQLKIDEATLTKNDDCMKIEDEALSDMKKIVENMGLQQTREVYAQLKDIKDKAAMTAPIPPLSDLVMEEKMEDMLYMHTMLLLVHHSHIGAEKKIMGALITTIVISYSEKNQDRYLHTLARLELEAHRLSKDTKLRLDSSGMKMVSETLADVKAKISAASARTQVAKAVSGTASGPHSEEPTSTSVIDPEQLREVLAEDRKQYCLPPSSVHRINSNTETKAPSKAASQNRRSSEEDIKTLMTAIRSNQMSPEQLKDVFRYLPSGPQTTRLRKDLEEILRVPTGKEDPRVIERLQRQIMHFANVDHEEQIEARQTRKDVKVKAGGYTTKFQEELTTGDEPSAPPYSANEGRARTAKLKQVPVSTPQVQDQAAQAPNTTASQITANHNTFDQRTADVSENLKKMRKELQTLTRLPGLDGARATRLRRQLDSVMEQVNDLDTEVSLGFAEVADESEGKGKEREITEADLIAPVALPNGTTKKVKKKGNKPSAIGVSTVNPSPNTPPLFPAPTFDNQLSEREEAVRLQLYNMMTNLRVLCGSPPPGRAIDYGIPLAFDGIVVKLQTQLSGHIATASLLCGVNDWTGLQTWIDKEFKRLANGEYVVR